MKTRIKKWAHYRAKIEKMDPRSFAGKKAKPEEIDEADRLRMATLGSADQAIVYEPNGGEKPTRKGVTVYDSYLRGKKKILLWKVLSLVAAIGLMTAFFFFWVKGA